MRSITRIIIIPEEDWEKPPLKDLVADALVAERRIRKKSNLEAERRRYSQICAHIEAEALNSLENRGRHVGDLDDSYLKTLYDLYLLSRSSEEAKELWQMSRAGKSFIPPNFIKDSFDAFNSLLDLNNAENSPEIQKRLNHYSENKEVLSSFGWIETIITHYDYGQKQSDQIQQNSDSFYSNRTYENIYKTSDSEDSAEVENLSQAIEFALKQKTPVNMNNPFHPEITKALREFSFKQAGEDRDEHLRIVYGDGSEAEPFPLFQLDEINCNETAENTEYSELHVSLISMRHLEQDTFVNMAWFNNQQASRPQKFAETEKYCSEVTIAQLNELRKPVKIHLYQTGLQPAIVGFFRGLVMWKINNPEIPRQELVVIPKFYNSKNDSYEDGKAWC